ncbi:MAG: RDD family protein [Bacilli bacterium]|nr:RDD family protein [Bacilli bacterium]
MKAQLKKRMTAYLIDIIIIIAVLGLISIFYKVDNSSLQSNMDLITLEYASGEVTFGEYMSGVSTIYKQMDSNNTVLSFINLIFIVLYFIVFPYFNNGQTIGKKMMSIEVRAKSNKKLNLLHLLLRNLVINGLIYLIAVIICTFIVPSSIYFMVITILGIIQIGLILSSMLMVCYRKDKKGLHDLLAGTWVAKSK